MQAMLDRITALKKELDALRPLPPEAEAKLRQKLNIEWSYNSNAIEGNTLTLGETRTLLLYGITAKGKPLRDHLDIQGHDHAVTALEEAVRGNMPLTQAFLRELHRILLCECYEVKAVTPDGSETKKTVTPGEYKKLPNHVRTSTGKTHFYASPEEVSPKMTDLFDWFAKEERAGTHPLIVASAFHYRFVEIHPFDDGNGRMARLLMNLILMKHGYVPAVIPQARRDEYIRLLEQMDEGGELEPFARFVGECEEESLRLAIRAAKGEEIFAPEDFDKRVELLKRVAGGRKADIEELAEYFKREIPAFDQEVVRCGIRLSGLFHRNHTNGYVQLAGVQSPLSQKVIEANLFDSIMTTKDIIYFREFVFDDLQRYGEFRLAVRTEYVVSLKNKVWQFIVRGHFPPEEMQIVVEKNGEIDELPDQEQLKAMVREGFNKILDFLERKMGEGPPKSS